ncbi:PREDICTED: RNA polymerase II degradation factor 1-like [Vollenhovia emeryi]|uniref:RNA polymerase II degradation factor 1-like n=1 Tax=Vollenhovia emeryi TaxID=411798 RepID=UPI0005F42832|nr:PREDICTED: RNA polymerase II degradation factor 1-like [Vollenhovia emeryi]
MDVLREREVKDSLERQLQDEQKVRVVYQKRLKKERRARKRLQEQLDLEVKRRTQLEEALKATGASSEQVRAITENVTAEARTSSEPPEASPVHSQSQQQSSQQQPPQQPLQQQQAAAQQYREAQVPRPSQQPSTPEKPAWGYGLDLIGSQASAFWQNYQGQFSQRHATSPSSYPVTFGFAVDSRFPRCSHGTARGKINREYLSHLSLTEDRDSRVVPASASSFFPISRNIPAVSQYVVLPSRLTVELPQRNIPKGNERPA